MVAHGEHGGDRQRMVLVAGHFCLDVVPEFSGQSIEPGGLAEVGPLRLGLGGAVGGTSTALADAGVDAIAAVLLGDDELGDIGEMLLDRRSEFETVVRRVDATTSYSIVFDPPSGDRAFLHHFGANVHFDGTSVSDDLMGRAQIIHLGYPQALPALVADEGAPLVSLLERARRHGLTTSLDFCVLVAKPPLVSTDWATVLRRTLPLVDVVSPSIDDLTSMPIEFASDLEAAAEQLVALGAGIALVTGGADGMALRAGSEERLAVAGELIAERAGSWANASVRLTPPDVDVVRTTGAGDAASAGLLAALLSALDPAAAAESAERAALRVVSGGTTE